MQQINEQTDATKTETEKKIDLRFKEADHQKSFFTNTDERTSSLK